MVRTLNLTRLNRSTGTVDPDLEVEKTARSFDRRFSSRRFNRSRNGEDLVSRLFSHTYSQADAQYRVDFLQEWVEKGRANDSIRTLESTLPAAVKTGIYVEDQYGRELSPATMRAEMAAVRKTLTFAQLAEKMAEHPGQSAASEDLRSYAKSVRRTLQDYEKVASKLRESRQFQNKEVDTDWAMDVFAALRPFREQLDLLCSAKKQLTYYKMLSIPFTATIVTLKDGKIISEKPIPVCKPIFLPSEERRGLIRNAYHPAYFGNSYVSSTGNYEITKLNVPNDIIWGKKRLTYIHGPNSRGKTVLIKTIGLDIHHAMAGTYCFADHCELSLPKKIHVCFDKGDSDKEGHLVTNGLKIASMVGTINPEDIALLDEAGRGSEPVAERIIEKGVCDGLVAYKMTTFCVTHDEGSWKEHRRNPSVALLCSNEHNDGRKYKILPGQATPGYAMRKAKELGIDPESIMDTFRRRFGKPSCLQYK